MKIEKFDPGYVITTLSNHEVLKSLILKCIEEDVNYSSFENIYKSDWHLSPDYERNYKPFLDDIFENLKGIYRSLGYSRIRIEGYWFQQYKKNDRHDWHVHSGVNFANVYFLENPESSPTEFLNPLDKTVIIPKIKEGDVLIFPGHLIHRSPPNVSEKRKTILAFNINVDYIE